MKQDSNSSNEINDTFTLHKPIVLAVHHFK